MAVLSVGAAGAGYAVEPTEEPAAPPEAGMEVAVTEQTAQPTPTPLPGISVAIENTGYELGEGDTATYRITVRNDSDVDYPQALISQTMSQALSFTSAMPAPAQHHENTMSGRTTELQWLLPLPAHRQVVIDMEGKVGEPANGQLKVATTACVMADGVTRPMVCSTDSDLYDPHTVSWGIIAGLAGLGVAVAWAARWWWMRRRAVVAVA